MGYAEANDGGLRMSAMMVKGEDEGGMKTKMKMKMKVGEMKAKMKVIVCPNT